LNETRRLLVDRHDPSFRCAVVVDVINVQNNGIIYPAFYTLAAEQRDRLKS
jgi:hypothetical protein